MPQPVADRLVVLDDGEYYVELDATLVPEAIAPGLLKRRCYISTTSPDGYECVGMFMLNGQNHWMAQIDVTSDSQSGYGYNGDGTRMLGIYAKRVTTIVDLWMNRRQAHCRHRD